MIRYIKINNFKLFNDLDIDRLNRINLIGGKNNIGKTALLEAINLNVTSNDFNILVNNIKSVLHRRHNNIELDIFTQTQHHLQIETDKKKIAISYENQISEPVVFLELDGNKQGVPISHIINGTMMINNGSLNINYIPSEYVNNHTLSQLYSMVVNLGKDELIDEALRLFDPNILTIRQVLQNGPVFKVKMKNLDKPILLSSLGDGINRFMAIICALLVNEDSYLFIDEIENGIHYTNYEKLWKIIFDISKEINCQVFITTHSKECIDEFNSINNTHNGTYIELYRNKKNQIVAKSRDKEHLTYSLTHNGRFRGE